jgi:2-polyprenyl-3-methyl-5-hydroxy-6-metoxy-1,4-benzoquinol methylase
MPDFSTRSSAQEIMDDLNCSGDVLHQTLRELDFINRWLGGNGITLEGISKLITSPTRKINNLHLADMGCGSGDLLRLIQQSYQHSIPQLALTGVDANPHITQFASGHLSRFPSITVRTANVFDAAFRKENFDVITATLFLHHFNEVALVDLLRSWKKQARLGIVINDLHRHPLAYYSIALLTRLFSRSSMVQYDAPLSVLRGFTRNEWVSILQKAGITRYSLNWKWAFRWQIIIPANER